MEEKILEIGARPAIDTIKKELGIGLIGVEVGVNKGYNATYICDIIKPKILYLIDPWNNFFDPASGEVIGETQYFTTKELLKPFPCCKIIKDISYNAVNTFDNESLDFVYIDSEHTYPSVLQEVKQWYPKVKKGGILSGHDFTQLQVKNAIIDFCRENKIDKLYGQSEDFWFRKE
mgnify:CR=1 FL=1